MLSLQPKRGAARGVLLSPPPPSALSVGPASSGRPLLSQWTPCVHGCEAHVVVKKAEGLARPIMSSNICRLPLQPAARVVLLRVPPQARPVSAFLTPSAVQDAQSPPSHASPFPAPLWARLESLVHIGPLEPLQWLT